FDTGASVVLSAYGQSPIPTANSVPVTTEIGATLSKQIDPSTVVISLKNSSGQDVPGATSYDAATRRAAFKPDTALAEAETFTAKIDATDLNGNAVNKGEIWTFTT